MFPELVRFMQYTNEVIRMLPEEKNGEVLRSAESIPKSENSGGGIDQLAISFYGKTYKSGIFF